LKRYITSSLLRRTQRAGLIKRFLFPCKRLYKTLRHSVDRNFLHRRRRQAKTRPIESPHPIIIPSAVPIRSTVTLPAGFRTTKTHVTTLLGMRASTSKNDQITSMVRLLICESQRRSSTFPSPMGAARDWASSRIVEDVIFFVSESWEDVNKADTSLPRCSTGPIKMTSKSGHRRND